MQPWSSEQLVFIVKQISLKVTSGRVVVVLLVQTLTSQTNAHASASRLAAANPGFLMCEGVP